jgi:acetyl esterase
MTIAPEIQSWIEWGSEVGARHTGLEVPELRKVLGVELDEEMRRRGVKIEHVAGVSDHAVDVDGGRIRIRAFRPQGSGPHPAFVHFHGGGFVYGTIDSVFNNAKCAHICNAAACVVVTVDYRLAPEHRFPTAPEDCYAALLWTVANAADLDIDPTRIAVGGESAGGNLAAVVALMARDRGGPDLALQMLEVPVTDISDGAGTHPSTSLFGEGYGLDRLEMDAFSSAYLPDPGSGANPYASPLLAPSLSGLASAHVITAEYDILRDSGEAYADRLEAAGVPTTRRRMLAHTHGSSALWQDWQPAREWMDDLVQRVRLALHDPRRR